MKKTEAIEFLENLIIKSESEKVKGNLHGVNLDGTVIDRHHVETSSSGQTHSISSGAHTFKVKTDKNGGITHTDAQVGSVAGSPRDRAWGKIKTKLKNN